MTIAPWLPVSGLQFQHSGRSGYLGDPAISAICLSQLSSSLGELAIWVILAIWLSSYAGYLGIQESSHLGYLTSSAIQLSGRAGYLGDPGYLAVQLSWLSSNPAI